MRFYRLATCAVFCLLLLLPFFDRGYAAALLGIQRDSKITKGDDAAARALSASIESLIRMRLAMIEKFAPSPTATEADPQVMSRHIAAINDLSDFSEQTVLGLIDAATDRDTRKHLAGALVPVVARHEQDIAVALSALSTHPLGRDNGLLKRAEIANLTSQRRVLARLNALATQPETRLASTRP